MTSIVALVIFLSGLFLIPSLLRFLGKVWWTPRGIQKMMNSQGVKGRPYAFPHGNTKLITGMRMQSMGRPMPISHDIFSRIEPHVYSWIKIYGRNFLNWHGFQAQFFVTELELVKEILHNKEGAYRKMDLEGFIKKLLGDSILVSEGEKWAKIRKVANHTFHADSLKRMVPEMLASVDAMVNRWKDYEGKEIDVHKEFGLLASEVISRTAFGSSYVEGKHIFDMVGKQTALVVRNEYKVRLPGISVIMKSDDEIATEKLKQGIRKSILDLVKKRQKSDTSRNDDFGSDYLGQLITLTKESDENKRITIDQMIDEIKALFGAGHLTIMNLLTWTVFLLATHQDWQEKVRKEVLESFGVQKPTSDDISRLKIMNMVINESLRLYPVITLLTRQTKREAKLGSLTLPAKLKIFIPILSLHHDPKVWGNDVHLFNPERFSEGIAKATNNNSAAFLPFGMGPRTCVGLNFSTNEAKIALSMILQRYKLALSSNYIHCPAETFVLMPQKGVQVILHKL